MIHNRKNLILSVDDFGISEIANKNILELVKSGKVDRVSVMTEGNINSNEIRELLDSGVKLDVHLELENAKESENRKLKAGVFKRAFSFFWKLFFGANDKENVRKKWEDQIEKFKTIFGKYPDGINSHEHVHFFPAYFRIALELGKKYQIPYIRMSRNTFKEHCLVCRILNHLRKADLKILEGSQMLTSDFMASADWARENVESFLEKLPAKTEIIFHPERTEEYNLVKSIF